MAAPTFGLAGTFGAATIGLTVAWPTHAANEVGLLVVETCGGEPVSFTNAAGFTAVANSPQATGATTTGTQLSAYVCRATSSSQTNPVIADPGNHIDAVIVTIPGCITTGDPWDVTAGSVKASTSTSASAPGVTTTAADTLVVNIITRDSDEFTTAQFSGESNGDLTGLVERVDNGTQNGNGGGIAIYTGVRAAAGTVGATTATLAQTAINASLTIAFKPPGGGATNLVVADATSATTTDPVVLTQAQTLVVADATGATTADNATLTQAHVLAVADATSASTADNVALTQAHTLTVADASTAATADDVTIGAWLATYTPHGWVGSVKTVQFITDTVYDLAVNQFNVQLHNIGAFDVAGEIDAVEYTGLDEWITTSRSVQPEQKIVAWLSGTETGHVNTTGTHATIAAWVAAFVAATGVDGVMLDFEPFTTDNANYVTLLTAIRAAIPDTWIGVDAPGLPDRWTAPFMAQVAAQVDAVSPMIYDSSETVAADYTAHVVAVVNAYETGLVGTGARLYPSLPAYEDNAWHARTVENLETASEGVRTAGNTSGAAVYWWFEMLAADKAKWAAAIAADTFGPVTTPPPAPFTFGETSAGPNTTTVAANNRRGSLFELTAAGDVTKLSVYLDGLGSGTGDQVARAVIYAGTSGSAVAGDLAVESAEVTVTDGQAAGWVDFVVSPPVELTAGFWWLQLHVGTATNTIRVLRGPTANLTGALGDTYSDGAATPGGTLTLAAGPTSIYATYTPGSLTVADATSASTADNAVLTQAHALAVADATSASTTDAATLTQVHSLTVADATTATTADPVVLTPSSDGSGWDDPSVDWDSTTVNWDATGGGQLDVADATSASTADNAVLTQVHALAVADATSATTADNAVLAQAHVLTVADAVSASTADNAVLTQAHALVVVDATSASTADDTVLSQDYQLVVADVTSASTADAATLTQAHTLTVADATSATTADNVDIDVSGATNLVVADATSASTADNVVLTQAHTLAAADATSASNADNAALTQAHTLVVADATSATTADNVVLTQAHALAVVDATSASTADAVTLIQGYQLTVADATSASTADNAVLTQAHTLTLADAVSPTTADDAALTQAHTLTVADATSATTADNVVLAQVHALVVADVTSGSTADNAVIATGGPAVVLLGRVVVDVVRNQLEVDVVRNQLAGNVRTNQVMAEAGR